MSSLPRCTVLILEETTIQHVLGFFCALWGSDFGSHISMANTLLTEMELPPENTFLKDLIFVFSCECLCVHEYSAPGTQQGTGSFGPGILSDCGQTSMGAGNITPLQEWYRLLTTKSSL